MAVFLRHTSVRAGGVALRVAPLSVQATTPAFQVLSRRANHGGVHFRESKQPHPLQVKPHEQDLSGYNGFAEDHGRLWNGIPNHIWSEEEVQERLQNLWQHRPVTKWDRVMHSTMWGLYRGFNWMTGFKPVNTPVRAVE